MRTRIILFGVDSLAKVIAALERLGIELINDDAISSIGGRGVRLKVVASAIYKARDMSPISTPKKMELAGKSKRGPLDG